MEVIYYICPRENELERDGFEKQPENRLGVSGLEEWKECHRELWYQLKDRNWPTS